MRRIRIASLLLALALPLSAHAAELTVSAAASLTDAFNEINKLFSAKVPGTTVRANYGASGTLLQQMAGGAQVDVFASADQATMDKAVAQKLVDARTRRDFATNSVVLITPMQDAAPIKSVQDLDTPTVKRIAIGKVASVPVGRYTQQVLESARLWTTLEPKFVPADSVRQVLDYVARGEVDAGFVYRTDAAVMKDKVRIVLTAEGHTPVSYPVAVGTDSAHKDLARQYADFLATPQAREVLERYGFGKP
ncbi:molybdate ABC transporter substrate-binding protein [Bordetella genomosp. 13]|uniref:molybdate ABC transporter substrate-binding protein n=1 Tax=Bordetella genomosp. 13 TaxID=463040 RepID=UPI0011A0F23B|nr:molybdate ABC transporter substrate-binding protein [Bordetella genomosp. 13]